MPPYHLSSTSRALYRIFIQPTLHKPSFIASILTPTLFSPQFNNAILPHPTIRLKSFKKKDTQRHALSDHYTLDDAIRFPYINFIDDSGAYHADVSLTDALRSFNRVNFHLVLVAEPRVTESGEPDPDSLPTCKVVSKIDLRSQHQKKLDIARRAAKGMGAGPSPKSLELNWAIAGGDLKHRLMKMQGFLREGRKVEVLLGPKKRGRVATGEECASVLKAVRDAVAECKGAGEAKEAEGKVGGVMTLVFEGRKMVEKKEEEEKKSAAAGL
jgi:translation initiation factor IF-3